MFVEIGWFAKLNDLGEVARWVDRHNSMPTCDLYEVENTLISIIFYKHTASSEVGLILWVIDRFTRPNKPKPR